MMEINKITYIDTGWSESQENITMMGLLCGRQLRQNEESLMLNKIILS